MAAALHHGLARVGGDRVVHDQLGVLVGGHDLVDVRRGVGGQPALLGVAVGAARRLQRARAGEVDLDARGAVDDDAHLGQLRLEQVGCAAHGRGVGDRQHRVELLPCLAHEVGAGLEVLADDRHLTVVGGGAQRGLGVEEVLLQALGQGVELEGLAVEDLLEPAGQRDLGARRRRRRPSGLARAERAGDREVPAGRLDPADEDREVGTDDWTSLRRSRPAVGHCRRRSRSLKKSAIVGVSSPVVPVISMPKPGVEAAGLGRGARGRR